MIRLSERGIPLPMVIYICRWSKLSYTIHAGITQFKLILNTYLSKKPDAPLSHVASDFNYFIKSLSELIA